MMKKQLLVVGYDTGVQHQDEPAPDLAKYLLLDAIDLGAFEALTGTAEGLHGDFTIAADSVHATPIDAHTLSLLNRDDRRLMREFLKLRLALPRSPIELVEFVDATEGAFTLPDGYAAQVRSRTAGVMPASIASGKREKAGPVANWKMQIQAEATAHCLRLRQSGASPTRHSIQDSMAKWCRYNDVKTDTKIFPSSNYLRTHVLGGKHWDVPK